MLSLPLIIRNSLIDRDSFRHALILPSMPPSFVERNRSQRAFDPLRRWFLENESGDFVSLHSEHVRPSGDSALRFFPFRFVPADGVTGATSRVPWPGKCP